MMEDFQKIHGEISDKLNLAENEASESLRALGKTSEEIEEEAGAIMEKMAVPIVGCLKEHGSEWQETQYRIAARSIRNALAPLVADIPKELGQMFADAVIQNKEWRDTSLNIGIAGDFFSIFLSLLSQKSATSSFEFSESDFPSPPSYFGSFLEEPASLTLHGNAGDAVGDSMKGGSITILGNVGDFAGYDMENGSIKIEGNTGKGTGWDMGSGTLDIRGEVESFDLSAFTPENKGTIIWKGVKIWENGDWTLEGSRLRMHGKIRVRKK